jgi:hypothetical protein
MLSISLVCEFIHIIAKFYTLLMFSQGTFDEFTANFDPKYLNERVPPRDLSLLQLISIGIGESVSLRLI